MGCIFPRAEMGTGIFFRAGNHVGRLSYRLAGKNSFSVRGEDVTGYRPLRYALCTLVLLAVMAVWSMSTGSAYAQELSPVARKVLVLYNPEGGHTRVDNPWRRGFDMVGNYYGMLSVYHNMNTQPLPDVSADDLRGVVILWSSDAVDDPLAVFQFGIRCLEQGIPVMFVGTPADLPYPDESELADTAAKMFRLLGFAYAPESSNASAMLKYDDKLPLVEFERRLPLLPPAYAAYSAVDDSVKPWLSVNNTRSGKNGLAVAMSPNGVLALQQYLFWMDPGNFKRKWYVEPFALVRHFLRIDNLPSLTPTTLNGKRVAFSHVDADGFVGFTEVVKGSNCAHVLYDEVFSAFDFPITVSVITAEVDPEHFGSEAAVDIARKIFRLPNVEPGSHSFTHPFYWDPDDAEKAALFSEKYALDQYAFPVKGYSFSNYRETVESCRWITENLTPEGKPCELMQWSGSCDPGLEAMQMVTEAGLQNINGGDTIYDELNDSLITVSPLLKYVGPYVQVFTGQANENILTNLWTGPYHGFRYITRTMQRTGTPRRLMPINIYYHFYSAEKEASLQAVKDVYQWVMEQDIAPVFTTQYTRMVQSFTKASMLSGIDAEGRDVFVVSNYGDCLSLRFDSSEKLPDLAASTNVLGYDETEQGLFVHLAGNAQSAKLVMQDAVVVNNRKPYLASASGWITRLNTDGDSVSASFNGFGNGHVVFAGLYSNTEYAVRNNGMLRSVVSDAEGRLVLDNLTTGTVEIGRQ